MERLILICGTLFIAAVSAVKMPVSSTNSEPYKQEILTPAEIVSVHHVNELEQLFTSRSFDIDKVRSAEANVPSIHLASLPKDIKHTPHNSKKEQFLRIMLPLILDVNQKVMVERNRLQRLQRDLDNGIELTMKDERWLNELAERYRVKSADIDKLLVKVDVIPPSLALAQASLESGWLMSAAARHKNSTFGHMANRKDVQGFENLYANVEAYILNLNRHAAYRDLRKLRAEMRNKGKQICSITLAKGLKSYSERGMAYIRDIQNMIKQNDFKAFDSSTLDT